MNLGVRDESSLSRRFCARFKTVAEFSCNSGPLLFLPRRSLNPINAMQPTWRCKISHTHLSCQVFPVPSMQLFLFCPIKTVNFPTFAAMVGASFVLIINIIPKETSSSSACERPPPPPFAAVQDTSANRSPNPQIADLRF